MDAQEIIRKGRCIDHWAIDSDRFGELVSNGGMEGLYLYNGKYYLLQFDYEGLFPDIDTTPIDMDKMDDGDFIKRLALGLDKPMASNLDIAKQILMGDTDESNM